MEAMRWEEEENKPWLVEQVLENMPEEGADEGFHLSLRDDDPSESRPLSQYPAGKATQQTWTPKPSPIPTQHVLLSGASCSARTQWMLAFMQPSLCSPDLIPHSLTRPAEPTTPLHKPVVPASAAVLSWAWS